MPSSGACGGCSGTPSSGWTSWRRRTRPGFHAPEEAARILGEAIDFARQGQVLLRDPTFKPQHAPSGMGEPTQPDKRGQAN